MKIKILLLCALVGANLPASLNAMQNVNQDIENQQDQIEQISGATDQELKNAKICPICQDEFKLEDNQSARKLAVLRCNPQGVPHIYHTACLDEWVLQNPSCPMCKSDLSKRREQIEQWKRFKHALAEHHPLHPNNRTDLIASSVISLYGVSYIVNLTRNLGIPLRMLAIPAAIAAAQSTCCIYLTQKYTSDTSNYLLNRFAPRNRVARTLLKVGLTVTGWVTAWEIIKLCSSNIIIPGFVKRITHNMHKF